MAKKHNYQKASPETEAEAMKMAKATQRPGQTKEQTRLIAQGIKKGIDLYKKQQKEKSRELNRKLQKVSRASPDLESGKDDLNKPEVVYKQFWLSWFLLVISWLGMAVYFLF